jgi:hypothetical protein
MTYNLLENEATQIQAKEAIKRQLLRQYDALNEALLLGKEDKFTGFYDKTIAPHQKTLLGDIIEHSGITTKALDDVLEQINTYAHQLDDTKIDSSLKRLQDACRFTFNLANNNEATFNAWLKDETLLNFIQQGKEKECYNQLIKLAGPNHEHIEQLLQYAIPNPSLKKLQNACAYVCNLNDNHKQKFLTWLEKNSTYTPNKNNNINKAIREIAGKDGYDKCYDELRHIVKSEYTDKMQKSLPNWKERKQKLLEEKQKNSYDEYFLDEIKKEFTDWVNSHLVKNKIQDLIKSKIDDVNAKIDTYNLPFWEKYFLKKEFYDRVDLIYTSGFEQSKIDEFDLTKYSPQVQRLFTDALNDMVNTYRLEPAVINDFDSAWEKTETIPTDIIYDKLDELTEKNYQANFNRSVNTARNSAETELNTWVDQQQESRTSFEQSLEDKSASELLIILAETTKITTRVNKDLEKLNNASYDEAASIVATAKAGLDSGVSIASGGNTPTEAQYNIISGPADISQYEINETRKLLSDFETQFDTNPDSYTEQDKKELARWIFYQNNIKQDHLNDFNEDIGKKLSLGFTDDGALVLPDYRLRSRIQKIIEHGSYNQITDSELNKFPKEIKKWLQRKRQQFRYAYIPDQDTNIKQLTDEYCADANQWNRYQKRKLINTQLNSLLDAKEAAIQNSLLGKARLEKAKALYRDLWTRRGLEHAFGFAVSAALTMAGSLIFILIAMVFFSTPPGMALMLYSTAIILAGVYLGNWWITKHDVAELFLTIFPDPNKSWIRQFVEEAIKNPLAFTVSNFAAFLSALFTAVAAYAVAATIIALFAPISLPIMGILLLTVAAPSFYYTYPTYFAISHIFSRIMTRNTYSSHLKEIEDIAIINDQTSIRKWYPFLLGLAMLAILGVMLAAAPALFVGFAFVGVPVILAQVLGYAMVALSMGGIGSFYFFRSRNAAVRLIKDNGGRDPFKNLKENALREMNRKPNPHKLTILANILEQLNKFNLTLDANQSTAKEKLTQAVLNEILFDKNPEDRKPKIDFLNAEDKAFLQADQGTLGKLYRIYQVRENAQEALTLWGKSFESIRILNAVGNMLPSVFGFMAGLPAGTPIAVIWALGIMAGVGGTGASWAANSNGIETDYTVEPEVYAAQRNLNDLITIAWFTNLNAFDRALNLYKNKHKDMSMPDYAVCLKLIKLAKDINDNGCTKEVISDREKEIIKNSHLNKIYEEMGEHLVRAVEVQQGKHSLLDQNINQQLIDYRSNLDAENRWYEYSLFGYTRAEKILALDKLNIIRGLIENKTEVTSRLTPKEIKILKNGRLGKIYNQMDKYTISFIELNGYIQELGANLFSMFFPEKFSSPTKVGDKLLKIINDIQEKGFTKEFLTPDELKIAKSDTLGKIFSNMDKNVTGPIELAAYKQQLKVEVGEEDTENNKRSDSNFSVLGFKFGFAKTQARTFQITIFNFSFSFTIPRFKGYSKAEKWQALEALKTPIIEEAASAPASPNTSAPAKPIVRSADLKTFYGNGRLGQIFANLDSPAIEKLINQDSTSGELAALIQELKDYSADRKNGNIYSTGDTNLGAASRAEKIAVAGKLQYALEEISSKNYTTCKFTDREREILTDGKLKDIYVKAQKYIDVLYVPAPAVRLA